MIRRLAPFVLGAAMEWAASSAHAVSFAPEAAARLARTQHGVTLTASAAALRARGIDAPNTRSPLRLDPSSARVIHGTALVLLLDFPDKSATTPVAHFDSLLFARNWGSGSLRDYYLEVSRGRLDVSEGGVFGWYRMPHDYAWYVDGQRGFGPYPRNAQRLAEDALAAAHAAGVDFADYDNDGPDGIPRSRGSRDDDGLIDGIFLVHAGSGAERTANFDDIHSHEWGVHAPVVHDGTTAWLYSMEPEDGTVGVFCHEYGHVLGLPDLYDTGDNILASGIGDWSLMGTGSWLGTEPGDTPAHLDAWSKAQLGFVDVDTVRTWIDRVRVEPVERDGGRVFRLATPGLPSTEYFLVENRQPLGFDRFVRGAGLLVYHVDETVARNDNPAHYKVAVVQADNLFQLEGKNFPDRGDPGDPFPGITAQARFGGDTAPSNAYYRLGPSQVAFEAQGFDGYAVWARFFSTTNSFLHADAVTPRWRATPRGTAAVAGVTLTLRNLGLRAGRIEVEARSLDAGVTLGAVSPSYLEAVEPGGVARVDVEATAATPPPAAARLEILTRAGDGTVRADTVVVDFRPGLGAMLGTPSSLDEAAAAGWAHASLKPAAGDDGADAWRLAVDPLGDPARLVWTSGRADSTTRHDLDAVLVTPPVRVAPGAMLRFRHRMDADVFTDRVGWDGGVVDVSLDGGMWTRVEPEGGYPYWLHEQGGDALSGQHAYSGHATGWTAVAIPLDPALGGRESTVRVRFRFASGRVPVGSGWWIDDIALDGGTPERLGLTAAAAADRAGAVHLAWTPVAGEVRVERTQSSAGSADVGAVAWRATLPAAAVASGLWMDTAAPAGEHLRYILTAGARADTVALDTPLAAARFDVGALPARGTLPVRLSLLRAGRVVVRAYDATGRVAGTLFDGIAPAGDTRLAWAWRTGERPLPAGVYLLEARLLDEGTRFARRVALLGH